MLEQINIRKSQLNQKLIDFQNRKDGQENAIKQFEEQLEDVNKGNQRKFRENFKEYKRKKLVSLRIENSKIK